MELNKIYNENCLETRRQTPEHVAKKAAARRRGSSFDCEVCRNAFWRKPSEIKKGVTRFCSLDCYAEWQKGKPKRFGDRPYLRGANNPRWKGGVTPENVRIRTSGQYKEWRTAVFIRDGYTCQECSAHCGQGKNVVLNADHIKSFADFPELRFEVSNGRTLCVDCHKKTPNYGWKSFNARTRT